MTKPNKQGKNPVNTQPGATNTGGNTTDPNAHVNAAHKSMGVFRPVDTPAIGDYSSDVDAVSNFARSAAFEAMNNTIRTSGGMYLEFAKIQDKETFNTNFATQFTELTNSYIASLESQIASSSIVTQLKEDVRLVEELIENNISSSNNTDDMFQDIDIFITAHTSNLSPQTIFKVKSLAVTALQNTYSCIDGQVVKNAYGYLTNLSATEQNEINKFLTNLNLGEIDDVSHCEPLLDTLALLIMGAGIGELPSIEREVKKLFAEQDPTFAAKSKKYQQELTLIRLHLDDYVKKTDKAEQAKIRADLDSAISSFNSLYPPTTTHPSPLDINDLIDFSASTNIIKSETTAQKALELDSFVSFPQLRTLYNQLKAEAYPGGSAAIDQGRLDAAITAMEGASKRFKRSLYFVDSMQVKPYYPKSIWEVLGIKSPTSFADLKSFIAPATFRNDLEVNNHIAKVQGKYGIKITRQQLLGSGSWDQYDPDKVNVDEIIGLKGVDFTTAEKQFENITNSLSGTFNPTTFKSALSLFNSSVQNPVNQNLFVEEVTTPLMNQAAFPANEFEILGVSASNLANLQTQLTPVPTEDVTAYIARCSGFGVAFDADVISKPKIEFKPIDSRISAGLDPTDTVVNINSDQAAIALMGLTNNIHACKLDPTNNMSPEAILKSGAISFAHYQLRKKFDNIRQKFQTQEINKKQVKRNSGRRAFKKLERETYFLDYKEAMLSLALDYKIFAKSTNTALKSQIEHLAQADKLEDFEAQAKNMTDKQLLTICAELNSFAEGNRKSAKHGDKNIMFKSDKDIALVRRFNSFAIEFIEKRTATNVIQDAKLDATNMKRVDKLRKLSSITSSRMSGLSNIVDLAYTGSQKPANYRFMLGVKQELDIYNSKLRGWEAPWSKERGFMAGRKAKQKMRKQIDERGFFAISKHGNLISNYGRFLTTVSDLMTSPVWMVRQGFKPSINALGYTSSSLWRGASWLCTSPFKAGSYLMNQSGKALNAGLYGIGWTAGLPIRLPYQIVTGTWRGAVAA